MTTTSAPHAAEARRLGWGTAVIRILLGVTFLSNGLAKLFDLHRIEIGPYLANLIDRGDARFILDAEGNTNAPSAAPGRARHQRPRPSQLRPVRLGHHPGRDRLRRAAGGRPGLAGGRPPGPRAAAPHDHRHQGGMGRRHGEPFFAWLAGQLGTAREVTAVDPWGGISIALGRDQLDFAWMGPFDYVLANARTGPDAIATAVRREADLPRHRGGQAQSRR